MYIQKTKLLRNNTAQILSLTVLGHSSEVLLTGLPPALSVGHTYSNPCNITQKLQVSKQIHMYRNFFTMVFIR
jgi:hypothetical protein